MRIVAITDIHGNRSKVGKLVEVLRGMDFDILAVAGDLTHFGGAERAREVLTPLLELKRPVVAVHGNCDGLDVPPFLEGMEVWAHDRRVEIGGVGIVGIGGSNITPFRTFWELTEDEIEGILERNYRDGDVILSHVPPKDTNADRVHSGLHVGSPTLRGFIERKEPPLVLTGHIHEARSVDRIGGTVIVNPGPLFRGYYAVVDYDAEKKRVDGVELERL
ncbi:YfcE family phosphodiesterase [Thermococcus sp. 18S1]|uniref:metallophosphoesterase n=1 Tax=Thermococcus sp. 18S1 TaxID=1638210 RepID=UPI00143BCC65|nr:YfcE family phosphodiesterase [Thermococcus sp. 18S1]